MLQLLLYTLGNRLGTLCLFLEWFLCQKTNSSTIFAVPPVAACIFQDVQTFLTLIVLLAFWPVYPVVALLWAFSQNVGPIYRGELVLVRYV